MSAWLKWGKRNEDGKRAKKGAPDSTMPVWDHLRELRTRLILALIGVVIAACAAWFFTLDVLDFLHAPLREITTSQARLNFETVGGALDLRVSLALWMGVVASSPWWIYQIGRFIWPGLKPKEKIRALGFGGSGAVLFAAGCVMGLLFIPKAVEVLLSFVPDDAAAFLRVDAYVRFCVALVLGCGFSMLFPVVCVGLNRAHVLSARLMLKAWRWVVLIAFVFAAIINPLPNPLPMTIQALILIAFYFGAVGLSALFERADRKNKSDKTKAKQEQGEF